MRMITGQRSEQSLKRSKKTIGPKDRKKSEKKTKMSKEPIEREVKFIAIDGEGVNDPTRNYHYVDDKGVECVSEYQMYTLLCASTGEDIENDEGLSSYECLVWLCNLSLKYPDATFIVFSGSYDMTMWLRDLEFEDLKYMHDFAHANEKQKHAKKMSLPLTSCCECTDIPNSKYCVFGIDYISRKEFKCYRYEVGVEHGRWYFKLDSRKKKIKHGSFHCYDVWGFFQCSFIKCLEEYGILQTVEDQEFLEHMKAKRGKFTREDSETTKRYCHLECELLVKLMDKLKGYLHHPDLDLKLTRWDGAGAIASALLKKYEVASHIEALPEDVLQAACHAFSGGRIELIRYGHTDKAVYGNDINSAYPSVMQTLPSLKGGKWEWSTTIDSEWALVHVEWNLSGQRIYPFFYRTREGNIIYPEKGEGWYWLPEYTAAKEMYGMYSGRIKRLGAWNFYPASDIKPFEFISRIAKLRLKWKEESRLSGGQTGGQHVTAKGGLNSLFGKTAQQVGGHYDEETGIFSMPKTHNLFYAGWITSFTRAEMYRQAMRDPEAVIMFATDGLFTTRPLDLNFGKELGQWELTEVKNGTFVQSGVYFFTDISGKRVEKNRGFERGSITEENVLKKWGKGRPTTEKPWEVVGSSKAFITFGKLATGVMDGTIKKNFPRLACWETHERVLSLTPSGTKREHDPVLNPMRNRKIRPERDLVPTNPLYNEDYCLDKLISKQYEYLYLKMDLSDRELSLLNEIECTKEDDQV